MNREDAPAPKITREEAYAGVKDEQTREATAELRAMDEAFRVLHPLSDGAQKRALRWLAARLDNFPDPVYLDEIECPF